MGPFKPCLVAQNSRRLPQPRKTFFKNIPRRIFKDRRDAEGVLFLRPPLYLFGKQGILAKQKVIRS
ncbi:MAG: hypothetical protein BHV92_01955 [Clostridiales bacterium 45_37]|nr:MAG: hypothetical protein BHV92_01955 [Clostridiales bacterium 45_37]